VNRHGNSSILIEDKSFFPDIQFKLIFETNINLYDGSGSLKCTFSLPPRSQLISSFMVSPFQNTLNEKCKLCPSRSPYCSVIAALFISSWKNNAKSCEDVKYNTKWSYVSKNGRPRSERLCYVSSSKLPTPIFKWDPSCDPPMVIYLPEEYAKGTFESMVVPQIGSSSEVSQGNDFLNDAHQSESPTESLVPEITISSSLASSSEVAMDQETSIGVWEEVRIFLVQNNLLDGLKRDRVEAIKESFERERFFGNIHGSMCNEES